MCFFCIDFFKNFLNDSFLIDHKGRSYHAHIGFAVVHLLTPNAIIFKDFFLNISDQAKTQSVFLTEIFDVKRLLSGLTPTISNPFDNQKS